VKVLIIGAGPTGLAAALFCAARGHEIRIVEKRVVRSPHSRAFGVNARTLELLEETGATERFLANGRRMSAVNLWAGERHVVRNDLTPVPHRYNFLLVQSQADSERILEEQLASRGVLVERGVSLHAVEVARDRVFASLAGSREERVEADVLLGADGSGSRVRESIGIAFDGKGSAEPWRLYDVELEVETLASDEAHMVMLSDGALFLVRLGGKVWRVLGNVPDLLERLPAGVRAGVVHWSSDFGIAHKVAASFSYQDRVFLAGDAAHIHSGLGARGMNLGIEDAFVFADRLTAGQRSRYGEERRRVVLPLMRQIDRLTGVMRGHSFPARAARWVVPTVGPALLPLALPTLRRFVLGLDHPVERSTPEAVTGHREPSSR
jgi:2-polyprenyl-6-methoxyphenol hydroxylase-like FAD-dependent oxidoreductase